MIRSKKCFKCSAVKPLTEFYMHQKMADGHLNKCKECTKSDATTHRNKNLEKIRAYDRERAKKPERIKATSAITKAWRSEDSRRASAHSAVARALRNGSLVPLSCTRCGNKNAIAHHEDYDKPLEVVWLCQPCHKQRHKEILRAKT